MAFTCQNCGVINEDMEKVCNPISDLEAQKSCTVGTSGVCEHKVLEMAYRCDCGNLSATAEYLCKPQRITDRFV